MKYFKHQEIDQQAWDDCIDNSQSGNLFCCSWYLNIIHPGWDALIRIQGDQYTAVIPLLGKKKFNILDFHQSPPLAQSLGPVVRDGFNPPHYESVNTELIRKYVLLHYPASDMLFARQISPNPEIRVNFILSLNKPYHEIYKNYRRDRTYRLRQAKASDLKIRKTSESHNLLNLYSHEVAPKLQGGVNYDSIQKIKEVADFVLETKKGFILEAVARDNISVSAALFILHKDRIVYYKAATNLIGRQTNANTLILDYVIHKFSENKLVLDFEGSTHPGIADYFTSFGASTEHYFFAKYECWLVSFYLRIRRFIMRYS